MKQRLLTLVLALCALLLFYEFFLPKPPPTLARPSEPLSTDPGEDGELALWRWLEAERIPVVSLRQRYAQLNTGAASQTGNVLMTVLPHRTAVRADEWQALDQWLNAGNTVLVLAAMDDTPRWAALAGESSLFDELPKLSQLYFTAAKTNESDAAPAQALRNALSALDFTLEPKGQHPLLMDVHSVHASSQLPASRWNVSAVSHFMPLSLMRRADSGAAAMWLSEFARGQAIVLSVASPFSNREIDHADNAQLLANIIAWSRSPQGRVIFDDSHQGLSDFYDARAFFADPRLHHTLWWIVFLWLAFVLGPLPLRSAFSPWRPVDETALIDAGGRFYSNAVSRTEAARRMLENFFNRLRRRLGLPEDGEPLWDWLALQGAISSEQRSRLQKLYAQTMADERVSLTRLQNLLIDLQGRLA